MRTAVVRLSRRPAVACRASLADSAPVVDTHHGHGLTGFEF
jgi:hypothetical protein